MKHLFIAICMLISLTLAAAPSFNRSDSGKTAPSKKEESIVIRKGTNKVPHKFAPSKDIPVTIYIDNESITLDLPFEDFPMMCELEKISIPSENWTAMFTDTSTCEVGFGGETGDYKIILTSDNSTYIGYFTLE